MIRLITSIYLACLSFMVCSQAMADYVAVDKIYGVEEGMLSRTRFEIKWVQNSKGERWDLPTSYKDVTEYKYYPKTQEAVCYIQVKSTLGGVVGLAVDKLSLPTFYGVKPKTNNPPQKIDPEWLVFYCRKQ